MTTEVQTCINSKKWAKANLEQIAKKEAFLNNLKANINNLTKDINVGTRFVSTRDYDGNLYECKYAPHEEIVQKEVYMNLFDSEGAFIEKKLSKQEKTVPLTTLCLTKLFDEKNEAINMLGDVYIPYKQELRTKLETPYNPPTTVVLTVSKFIELPVLEAKSAIATKEYYEKEEADDEYPSIKEVDFTVLSYDIKIKLRRDKDDMPQGFYMCIFGTGYFPEIQRKASRIWVRKCNIIAEALGKNIDSSKKSINFTLKKMNVREMFANEIEKLKKIRKIYNTRNPEKARSATLNKLTEEQKRLEPTLKRLEELLQSLCDIDIVADAYYCKKYGYLIPLKAKIVVDLSGKTFETELKAKNEETNEKIDEQIEKKNELISEIVPAVLHPDRVEKEIEKYGIDGVFGDDIDVVKNGVVNKSVFG